MGSGLVTAVVPAAGEGRRLRQPGEPVKQLRHLGGAPLLVQTLRALERSGLVDAIVVAGPPAGAARLAEELATFGLGKLHAVVPGGATRQASVAAALAAAPAGTELVAVHDAVRPFLPADRLAAVLKAAREHGAAALAVPVADTLRLASGAAFGETVPREGLWRMQTPQVARLALLRQAHARFGHLEGTDEVFLLRHAGVVVRVVEGSSLNLKVTTPADWELAEALWPAWELRSIH